MDAQVSAGARAGAAAAAAMDLSSASGMQRFINRFGSDGAPMFAISLEIKILSVLVMLFLFLLFLIVVLWDRYGKEIGELYTPSAANKGDANGTEVSVNAVADEYTVYQKLPTFFYEYTPRKKQQ